MVMLPHPSLQMVSWSAKALCRPFSCNIKMATGVIPSDHVRPFISKKGPALIEVYRFRKPGPCDHSLRGNYLSIYLKKHFQKKNIFIATQSTTSP